MVAYNLQNSDAPPRTPVHYTCASALILGFFLFTHSLLARLRVCTLAHLRTCALAYLRTYALAHLRTYAPTRVGTLFALAPLREGLLYRLKHFLRSFEP